MLGSLGLKRSSKPTKFKLESIDNIAIPGTGRDQTCNWGQYFKSLQNANDLNLYLMIFPHISLHGKLVSLQYRQERTK